MMQTILVSRARCGAKYRCAEPAPKMGPASAVHHHSASKTRVDALLVSHRARDTDLER